MVSIVIGDRIHMAGTGFPWNYFLSGIKAIPGDIYEACDIDGANLLQRLFYVTIPMLKETFIINIVLVVTGVFKYMNWYIR